MLGQSQCLWRNGFRRLKVAGGKLELAFWTTFHPVCKHAGSWVEGVVISSNFHSGFNTQNFENQSVNRALSFCLLSMLRQDDFLVQGEKQLRYYPTPKQEKELPPKQEPRKKGSCFWNQRLRDWLYLFYHLKKKKKRIMGQTAAITASERRHLAWGAITKPFPPQLLKVPSARNQQTGRQWKLAWLRCFLQSTIMKVLWTFCLNSHFPWQISLHIVWWHFNLTRGSTGLGSWKGWL